MDGIRIASNCDDQPIQASMMGDTGLLTSWVDPDSIDVQNKYDQLTSTIYAIEDKVLACLSYVSDFPYIRFVPSNTIVAGRRFVQKDTWLKPAQVMRSPKLNCANRAFLLASLLRQELPDDQVWVVFGNINEPGQDGHAWVYLDWDTEYVLEATNPSVRDKYVPLRFTEVYEDVVYFNDKEVKSVTSRAIREPFSGCWNCIPWLGNYVSKENCR